MRSVRRRSAAARGPSSRGCRARSGACGWSWRGRMPDLELQLRALAEDAVWPATPDIAAAVARAPRERRTGALARVRAALAPRGRRARRVIAAGLALLLLVPAAAVAFPG